MKKKIMIVDDDNVLAEALIIILQDEGFDTVYIEDNRSILAKLSLHKPDLIIMDYRMPGENGIEVSRRIRTNHETSTKPIIILTADLTNFQAELKELKINSFLQKPFEIPDLIKAIHTNL